MTHTHHHHRHGTIFVGRVMVAVACLLLLAVNGMLLKEGKARPHPLPVLQLIAVASLIWMLAGACAMCVRLAWGRVLTLTILYLGSIGYFMAIIITLTSESGVLVGRLRPFWIAAAVYLYVSLVLTHSKHVRRLTSRAYE